MNTEAGVAGDLQDFMEEFFKARPHLANRAFYITGESFAVRVAAVEGLEASLA